MTHRYECHNHAPRKNRQLKCQDGYNDDETRRMVVHVTWWQPIQCGHDFRKTDLACDGCKWRGSEGEQGDAINEKN